MAASVREVVGWTVRDRGNVTVMTGRNWIEQFTGCVCGTGGREQYLMINILKIKSMLGGKLTSLYCRAKTTNIEPDTSD